MNIFNSISRNDYKVLNYKIGDLIFKHDDVCSVIAYINSGHVTAKNKVGNDYKTIRQINAEDYIGINLVFSSNNKYRADFYAEDDVELFVLNKDELINDDVFIS